MTAGDRMKEIRLRKGLTQREVSARCHIAESTIRKYESGRLNPKFETMDKIASALEVPVTALMGYVFTGVVNGKDIYEVPRDVIDVIVDEKKTAPVSKDRLDVKSIGLALWLQSLPPEKQQAILMLGDAPADQLDCSVDYFLGRTERKEQPTSREEDGLTDDQQYLISAIRKMSSNSVKKLRIIVDQVIAEREQ